MDEFRGIPGTPYLSRKPAQKTGPGSALSSHEDSGRVHLNFATRLPSHLKLRGLQTKWLLKQSSRQLLPPSIINRPKKGFGIPVARWIKAELKPLLTEALLDDKIRAQGIFNPDCLKRLLQEHFSGAFDHRKKLWTLFMFQMWYSRYIEGVRG